MNEKTKELITFIAVMFISAVILLLIFMPEIFGNQYSIQSIKEHQLTIEELENELLRNEDGIKKQILEQERLLDVVKNTRIEAQSMKERIDVSHMKYHIPSLLITLEQSAKDVGIGSEKFFIDYKKITSTEERQKAEAEKARLEAEKAAEEEQQKKDPQSEEDLIEKREEGTTDEESPEKEEPNYAEDGFQYPEGIETGTTEGLLVYDNPETVRGLVVTTIPIEIKDATYSQVREYISFLDNLDFVEPAIADIYSEGESVNMVMLIHVYHQMEGGEANEKGE